ncbi:MAG TPA: AlpA family transcriptional regulator [Burkholderiaceae bacterium]|jgi:prophage regulatory protein
MPADKPTHPEIRLIRLPQVLALCGMSRSCVYDSIKKGTFPAPVKLSVRSSAWIHSEIVAWADARVNASRAPQDERA